MPERSGGGPAGATLALRGASADDADLLLRWANDPVTRSASLHDARISPDEHRGWLANVLRDSRRRLWIAMLGHHPVGQVRADLDPDGAAVISISLGPDHRGRGLGKDLLAAGLAAATAELGSSRARALVRESNEASRRLFADAGFRAVGGTGAPDGEPVLVLERDLA